MAYPHPGSWQPQPPPYSGAPPIPAGFNISPQQWNYGVWKPNPAYNPIQAQSTQQFVPWAAAPAWQQYGVSQQSMAYNYQQQQQQQQQQQPSHNPYKRIVRPASEEYYKSQLSDNPLGLENMVPADDIVFTDQQPVPQTPWLWQPRDLDDASQQPSSSTTAPEPMSRTSSGETFTNPPSSSRKSSRQPAESSSSTTSPHRRRSNSRRSTDPSSNVFIPSTNDLQAQSGVGSSYTIYKYPDAAASGSRDVLPSFDRPLDRPRDPSYGSRKSSLIGDVRPSSRTGVSSASASAAAYSIYTTPTKPPLQRSSSATPTPQRQQQQTPEPYTARAELKPTFSTKIIRTPDFYQKKTAVGNHQSAGSVESVAELAARSNRLDTSSAPPVARHSSLPHPLNASSGSGPSSILGAQSYAEEPSGAAGILSPLAIPLREGIDPASRGVTRHATVPVIPSHSLSAIPEATGDGPVLPKSPPPLPIPPFIRPSSTTPAGSSRRTSLDDYGASISRAPSRAASRPPSRSASRAAHHSTSSAPVSAMPNSQHTSPTTSLSSSSSSLASTGGVGGGNVSSSSASSRSSTKLTTPPSATMGVVGAGAGASVYWPTAVSSASASAAAAAAAAANGHVSKSAGSKSAKVYYSVDEVSPTGYGSGGSGSGHSYPERERERDRKKDRDRERDRERERDYDRERDREHKHRHHNHHHSLREGVSGTRSRGNSLSSPSGPPVSVPAPSSTPIPPQYFPGQFPPPKPYHGRLRQGFWNSRGDHLTHDGFVVYAPRGETYPDELKDYPSKEAGYLDERGRFVPWSGEREELRESLPVRGRPAKKPYESFKKYISTSGSSSRT